MRLRPSLICITLVATASGAAVASPKVIERYKQMLAANPVEGTALDRLWQAHVDAGRTGELLEEYRADQTFAGAVIYGHLLRKAGQTQAAIVAFERAMELDKANPIPAIALAKVHADEGRHEKAALAYEAAIQALPETDPKRAEVLLQLGASWLAAGDIEKAAAAWEKTVAVDPKNRDLRRRLADSYIEHYLGERAVPHLEYLQQNGNPQERAEALQALARVHQGAGRQDEAIAALERAMALTSPTNWMRTELQSQVIRLHQRWHRTEELEERWTKHATENPRDIGGILQLVELHERLGSQDKQREWLEKLVALAPRNYEYRLRLARLLVETDQYRDAAARYDELVAAQPTNLDLVFERARLDMLLDAEPAARQRIAAFLAQRPRDEAAQAKALEFYERHRLHDLTEQHLKSAAAGNNPEALIALAGFYHAQKRTLENHNTLARLVRGEDPPAQRAASHFQIAQILRGQSDIDAAVAAVTEAIKLHAGNRDYHMLLGELEMLRAQPDRAQPAYEKAYALSTTPKERAEVDQKLFESCRSQQPFGPERDSYGRLSLDRDSVTSQAAQTKLLALTREAVDAPTEERWLRVAHWEMWTRNVTRANDAANRALAINPQSIAAHDFLVRLHGGDPHSPTAVQSLEEMMRIDPANRVEYQRRLGQLHLQAGRTDAALQIFEQLVKVSPGDLEALTELAIAQQRSERWRQSLETWRKILQLSPGPKRKEAVNALLLVHDRLAMRREAAELLLTELDRIGDERERTALFHDLLAHCTKHGQLEWLLEEFERRRKQRTDDYFTEIALGRIHKALGNKERAFQLLADASFAAPNQAEALPELIREAEELRKLDTAIKLQSQLVRIVPQSRPDEFEKLARLQEKTLAIEEAMRTWEKIVAKFPRDAAAVEHAIDFQLKWGTIDRAAELLRRLRALDPTNVGALLRLADLEIDAGRIPQARECLEEFLRRTPPEPVTAEIQFPGIKGSDRRGANAPGWGNAGGSRIRGESAAWLRRAREVEVRTTGTRSDRELRLEAIRKLAEITAATGNTADLQAWQKRWQSREFSATERLTAFYHAGLGQPLLDEMAALVDAPGIDIRQRYERAWSWLWYGMEFGDVEKAVAWTREPTRTSAERQLMPETLEAFLISRGNRIEPAVLDKLFAGAPLSHVQAGAARLANCGMFSEAIRVSERTVNARLGDPANFGAHRMQWHVMAGDLAGARAALELALKDTGDRLEAPVFMALRQYWLLLPDDEREAFLDRYIAGIDESSKPMHGVLSRMLLHGLARNEREARIAVRELLAMRPLASDENAPDALTRRWDFILETGAQLQQWHLGDLALYLWEEALSDEALLRVETIDPSLAKMQPFYSGGIAGLEQPRSQVARLRINEVRTRWFGLKAALAEPHEFERIVAAFLDRSTNDGLVPLAEALESVGAYPRAVTIHRRIWEQDPTNPHALRGLLVACRTSGDAATLEEVVQRTLREGLLGQNDAAHRDLVLQFADAIEKRGDEDQLCTALEQAHERAPHDPRILLRLAQALERAGHVVKAEAAYRRLTTIEPANSQARLALAALVEKRGDLPGAIAILEKSSTPEIEGRLAELFVKAGRLNDALATLDRLTPPAHVTPTLQTANALAELGKNREAMLLLRSGRSRFAEVRADFPLQSRLIELLEPATDPELVAAEFARLRQMTGEDPHLLGSYFDVAIRESRRLQREPQVLAELKEAWDDGKGSLVAGVALLEFHTMRNERQAGEALCRQVLARADLTEALVQRTLGLVEKAEWTESTLLAQERLARRSPYQHQRLLDWARSLHAAGRIPEALRVVEEFGARSVFQETLVAEAGRTLLEFGQLELARPYFERAVRADPASRNFRTHLDFARLHLAEGNIGAARWLLEQAFRNPACQEARAIVVFLQYAGRLDHVEEELTRFDLSPAMRARVHRALYAHYEQTNEPRAALAVLAEHPTIMDAELAKGVRQLVASAGEFAGAIAALEQAIAQRPALKPAVQADLAALYGDWAEHELAEKRTDRAIEHLQRGLTLHPASLAIAKRLSQIHRDRGENRQAAEVLERFIAATTNDAEREQARQLRALLKP